MNGCYVWSEMQNAHTSYVSSGTSFLEIKIRYLKTSFCFQSVCCYFFVKHKSKIFLNNYAIFYIQLQLIVAEKWQKWQEADKLSLVLYSVLLW